MLKFEPVPKEYHESILGSNFNEKFSEEMSAYYQPFLSKNRKIQLAKETWEYAVSDSIPGGMWVGAGHGIVDVRTPTCDIDVKGLSVGDIFLKGLTTEASFLQNNKRESDFVATHFHNKNNENIKDMFVDVWKEKISKTNNLHLFAAIREKNRDNVHYCLLKVIPSDLTEEQFYSEIVYDNRAAYLPLIDSRYGKTCLYLPKRRMEIRLDTLGLKEYIVYSHSYINPNEQLDF